MIWPAILRRAALEFALPPDRLWLLSVKEWRALTGPPAAEPLSRGEFEALLGAHPDRHPRPATSSG
jgi:uncharacterized phage protein (TIGR02216 family)